MGSSPLSPTEDDRCGHYRTVSRNERKSLAKEKELDRPLANPLFSNPLVLVMAVRGLPQSLLPISLLRKQPAAT